MLNSIYILILKPDKYKCFVTIFLCCMAASTMKLSAQSFQLGPTSLVNGIDSASSASFQTRASVGQFALGKISSTSFSSLLGFEVQLFSSESFDLSIDNLTLVPTTVGLGNDIAISFDLHNQGDGILEAGSYTIAVYLSADQIIDAGEELRTISISSDIAAMGTYNFPQLGDNDQVTIPSSSSTGDFYIILRADSDNSISETDETNNEVTAALTITGDGTPPVLANFTPVTYFSTGATVSVSVTDNVGVGQVNFYHRGIITPEVQGWGTPVTVTSTTGVYTVELQAGWVDNQGVEYWFEAFDTSNNRDSTRIDYTYFQTLGGELNFPGFKKGRTVADYEMISVPFNLTDKNPVTVFSVFGTYDPKEWRMFQYTGGSTKEYNQGWNQLKLGESYWIINDVAGVTTVQIGEGKASTNNKISPFTINLVQGWNQIGNPYRFDVSWNDILTASGNPLEVEKFRLWSNGNFIDGSSLKAFGGGFVFTTAPTTLSIPVTPPVAPTARIAKTEKVFNPLDDPNWEVNFVLRNAEMEFIYGGLGMREDASMSKDRYDEVASPRFYVYMDMNFEHPEYFIPRFSKDVIPTQDNFKWEFVAESNSLYKSHTLEWNNSFFGDNDRELYLFDVEKQRFIDMRSVNEYSFYNEGSTLFEIYFGDAEYIESTLKPNRILLGKNYPNPFSRTTTIPFTLPYADNNFHVELLIYNQLGQLVKGLIKGNYNEGFYTINWDRTDKYGSKVPPGIYIYQIIVTNQDQRIVQIGKMAIH